MGLRVRLPAAASRTISIALSSVASCCRRSPRLPWMLASMMYSGVVAAVAFSPDGNVLGSVNGNGILHLWRAPSWAEIEAAERKESGSR